MMAMVAPVMAVSAQEARPDPELLIFVGKLAEVRELDYDCGAKCWNFDSGFELKYDVLEVMRGQIGLPRLDFEFFGHYGLPSFTHHEKALVFVYRTEHQHVMARYLAFPVEMTTNGFWAYCGDPYADTTPASARNFHAVRFEAPVALSAVTASFRNDQSRDEFVGKMKPGRRRCGNAVSAEDLIDFFESQAEPGYNRVYQFE